MRIIEEDAQIIVCVKNAGEAVQSASPRVKDMESMLRSYLAQKGEKPEVSAVHRLDQPVQGIVVFAKTKKAAASLSRQLTDGSMSKRYLALVSMEKNRKKTETEEEGILLTDWMIRDGKNNVSRIVAESVKGAKRAQLIYHVPDDQADSTLQEQISEKADTPDNDRLLEIELLTGRHHQIRLQLSHAGMPICGDRKYGPDPKNVDKFYQFPCLCAYHLEFQHPVTGDRKVYELTREEIWFLCRRQTM